jgi:hypothetical protein
MQRTKHHTIRIVSTLVLGVLAGLSAVPAASQSGGIYALVRSNVEGGGSMHMIGGAYEVNNTIGQADATLLQGGRYELGSGFWGGGRVAPATGHRRVYLPFIRR